MFWLGSVLVLCRLDSNEVVSSCAILAVNSSCKVPFGLVLALFAISRSDLELYEVSEACRSGPDLRIFVELVIRLPAVKCVVGRDSLGLLTHF